MKRFLKITGVVLCLFVMGTRCVYSDKKTDYQHTYNFRRGVELVGDGKLDEAEASFRQELYDHGDNGYALAWLASLQNAQKQYGEALTSVTKAMKHLPKKDEMYASCLLLRAGIHESLNEDDLALADLNAYVRLFPKDKDAYQARAQHYLNCEQYESAYKDFTSMTGVAPGSSSGYVGAGICLRGMKRYDEAIAKFDYAIKLNPQYAIAYTQRGYAYLLSGQFDKAADDIAKALDIDGNRVASDIIKDVADSAFEAMDFKLKVHQMMQPTSGRWPYYRGTIREHRRRYKDAVEMYGQSLAKNFNPIAAQRMAECKAELGDYEGALAAIMDVLDADSTDAYVCMYKAAYLYELGRVNESIAEYTRIIELEPDMYWAYHKRGWVKDNSGDTEGALEDYTMSIMLEPDAVYNYLTRGRMYERIGKMELAKADYEEVLKRDTVPSRYEAAFYAWWGLGDKDKAAAAMDSVLAADSIKGRYDATCLYSLMGEKEKALEYLHQALENGFRRFSHIEHDDDLDNIRETEEFKNLIEEYRGKMDLDLHGDAAGIVADDNSYAMVEEVPFTHEGGVTKIKCRINDLPLHFVFDTGASDVTISTVEATFMMKNGYLVERDITGRQSYMTADGNISEGTTIVLRKVSIGSLELDNVKASVVKSQKAPLLLGQSVLQRLGKIEIDNGRNVLKITKRGQ